MGNNIHMYILMYSFVLNKLIQSYLWKESKGSGRLCSCPLRSEEELRYPRKTESNQHREI